MSQMIIFCPRLVAQAAYLQAIIIVHKSVDLPLTVSQSGLKFATRLHGILKIELKIINALLELIILKCKLGSSLGPARDEFLESRLVIIAHRAGFGARFVDVSVVTLHVGGIFTHLNEIILRVRIMLKRAEALDVALKWMLGLILERACLSHVHNGDDIALRTFKE